jgi:hypothetical protein
VEYAKVKSKQAKNAADFERAWQKCPNCNQQYQNQLRLDLASAFVSFAETTYGYPGRNDDREFKDPLSGNRGKIMAALRVNIETIVFILLGRTGMNANGSTILAWDGSFDGASLRVEGEALINKLLSLWREVKKDKKMGGWVHMSPASDEYKYYKSFCAGYEAYAYDRLGGLYTSECTRESFELQSNIMGRLKSSTNCLAARES